MKKRWILQAAILLTPWFFFRVRGASVGDLLLLVSTAIAIYEGGTSILAKNLTPIAISIAFALVAILGLLVPSPIDFMRAAITIVQYLSVLLLLPIVSTSANEIIPVREFVRLIAFAFLLPLLVQIALSFNPNPTGVFFIAGRAALTYENPNSAAIAISIVLPFYVFLLFREASIAWVAVGIIGAASSATGVLLTGSGSGVLIYAAIVVASGVTFSLFGQRHKATRLSTLAVISIVPPIIAALALSSIRLEGDHVKFRVDALKYYASNAILGTRQTMALPPPAMVVHAEKPENSAPAGPSPTNTPAEPSSTNAPAPQADQIALDNVGDSRVPSVLVRSNLIHESLSRILDRYGIYGVGLGQAQVASGEMIVHNVYLLFLEEGGVFLLVVFIAFLLTILSNIRRALWDESLKACFYLSFAALILGGMFQTHLYLRFYWIPLLLCLSRNIRNPMLPPTKSELDRKVS